MGDGEAKGINSAIQGAVKFPLVVRVVLPGLLAVLLLLPFRPIPVQVVLHLTDAWSTLLVVTLAILGIGWLIARLEDLVYRVFEGRRYWPAWLRRWRTAAQQDRVRRLLDAAKCAKKTGGPEAEAKRAEIWVELIRYPEGDGGKRFASHPTLLGNILANYEDYPWSRYGMDSVFYWPRLWLAMDRETREDIDREWAVADGLLSMAAVCFLTGLVWIVIAIATAAWQWGGWRPVDWWGTRLPFASAWLTVSGGVSLEALCYLLYRMSIPFHLRNGELFKTAFDLFRDRLKPMMKVDLDETATWRGIWEYLQYMQVQCARCEKHFQVQAASCPFCGLPTSTSLKKLASLVGQDSASNARKAGVPPMRSDELTITHF